MNRYVVGIQEGAYKQEFSHHSTVVICTAAVAAKKGKVSEMPRDWRKTIERVHMDRDIMDDKGAYAYTLYGDVVASDYDLTCLEVGNFFFAMDDMFADHTTVDDFQENMYHWFQDAFLYGYVLGHRATMAGKYREIKKKDIEKRDYGYRHEKERA